MLDRQDIDALLVGALYGELSSAEEARLAAHLDSHPTDRSALEDLKSAHHTIRQKVQTSRIFELQLDPPQAVSALLLQEAARRAPRQVVRDDTKESWFQRFVRSFVAHPAMAAAATLVLVVGVAGSLYLRQGDKQFAEQRVAQNESAGVPAAAAVPSAPEAAWGSAALGLAGSSGAGSPAIAHDSPDPQAGKGAGDLRKDSVAVTLDEGQDRARDIGGKLAQTGGEGRHGNDKNADAYKKEKAAEAPPVDDVAPQHTSRDQLAFGDGKASAKPAKKTGYVEVPQTDHMPKDLEEERTVAKPDSTVASVTAAPGGVAGGAAPAPAAANGPRQATTPTAPPTAHPQPRAQAPVEASPPPPPPKIADTKAEPRTEAKTDAKNEAKNDAKPDPNLAWARGQHARVAALVKDGKCAAAAPLAVAIKSRAPDYYNSYVATDRALKPCMQYVNDAAERETEKAAKARRVDAVEAK